MENPIKMDDLAVPLFLETPIYTALVYLSTFALPVNAKCTQARHT